MPAWSSAAPKLALVPLDPAVAALAGTGLGAVLGGVAAWLIDRARWERQLDTRWDETRLAVYAQFLVAMQAYLPVQMAVRSGNSRDQEALAWKESLEHLAVISSKLSEMRLISSPEVHQVALSWFEAINGVIAADGLDDFLEKRRLANQAHDDFVETAGRELLSPAKRRTSGAG